MLAVSQTLLPHLLVLQGGKRESDVEMFEYVILFPSVNLLR